MEEQEEEETEETEIIIMIMGTMIIEDLPEDSSMEVTDREDTVEGEMMGVIGVDLEIEIEIKIKMETEVVEIDRMAKEDEVIEVAIEETEIRDKEEEEATEAEEEETLEVIEGTEGTEGTETIEEEIIEEEVGMASTTEEIDKTKNRRSKTRN